MFNNKLKKMEKRRKLPKVVMAASLAAMGMGLFSTLGNEARATGSGDCYQKMKYCDGTMTLYNCVKEYTSSRCSTFYYDCFFCDK